ncbi:SHOCT domain-containing protein [Halobaculum sp. WSA2]|uniref:SHOCT domain-containing protein n=1 Tax=Halobaculum saliterrae TaxID=2073113 RepID=A0A6B0SWI2_9EURY|nr:SHOCT domain-containing protein [Halobaculum saliterrae]MXR43254.1 SHOCT domain-containing protein [Halobaculum saliterrae]
MPDKTDDTRLITIVLIIIGAFVLFPMFFMGFGMVGAGPMMGGTWGHMWGDGTIPTWMVIAGIIMQLLFLATLVGGGYLLYQAITGNESASDQALEELRLAYARGELTDEEYEQRREALERDT